MKLINTSTPQRRLLCLKPDTIKGENRRGMIFCFENRKNTKNRKNRKKRKKRKKRKNRIKKKKRKSEKKKKEMQNLKRHLKLTKNLI